MSPAAAPDALELHRAAIRAAGFTVTPWRLGQEVGRAFAFTPREEPACPYARPATRRMYASGVDFGRQQARREARERAQAVTP